MVEVMDRKGKRRAPPRLDVTIEERTRIQFHISSLRGLPSAGWQPFASTFISVENVEVRESYPTEYKKSAPTMVWDENMPVMNLKNSSKVRFEVRNHRLWNKSVLGKTDPLNVQELLLKQREIGEERDSYIDINIPLNASNTPSSPIRSPKPAAKPDFAILTLGIRELADKDKNLTLTASNFKQFFNDCQHEALEETRDLFDKMTSFRKGVCGSSLACLLDIILGILSAVRKEIADPSTQNINKNTVAVLSSLKRAFLPYETLSERQLSKMGDGVAQLIKDMLHGAVRALAATEIYLKMKGKYESDKVEFKATLWVPYFQHCQEFISGTSADKPTMPASSRRIKCPPHMVAHPELSTMNFLPMDLPELAPNADAQNDRGDLVQLVSQWVFSSSFQLDPSNSNLESHLNSPQTPKSTNSNVFCLVSEAESDLNSFPTPRFMDCLNDMGYLGGYFCFASSRNDPARTSQRTIDALPITLTHQACTVEPDALKVFVNAFVKHPWAVNENMEKRFEALFASPMKSFVIGRPGYAWKPLEPMVFVLDCNSLVDTSSPVESHMNSGKEKSDPEDAAKGEKDGRLALARFVEWATSRVVHTLPAHVKFLILANKRSGLGNLLRDKGMAFVYEVQPIVSYV